MFAPQGLQSLLRDGGRIFSGVDEATRRNIENCESVARITRTSIGPNGLSKLIVNHIGKKYCTTDGSTMLQQIDVQHPAAKLLVMAAQMQHQEYGDGSNFVIVFAAELLHHAEQLLINGLHSSDILKGFNMAAKKLKDDVIVNLPSCMIDIKNKNQAIQALKSVCCTKSLIGETTLTSLIVEGVQMIMQESCAKFDVDNVRVAKLIGGSLQDSNVLNGMIITRPPNGRILSKGGNGKTCKVMMLGCGLESSSTEAKSTVLLHSAQELLDFSKGDEKLLGEKIKAVKDAGVDVIIVHGGSISDVAQHFCDQFDILTLKIQSKFEARRVCRALGCVALIRLDRPEVDDLGIATSISIEEIGSRKVTKICAKETRVCTIILRGSTASILDEAERVVEAGVHTLRNYMNNPKAIAGAGASEIEISRLLQEYSNSVNGIEQYGIQKYGQAFEVIPRMLAESCGENSSLLLNLLFSEHNEGKLTTGVDIDGIMLSSFSRSFYLNLSNSNTASTTNISNNNSNNNSIHCSDHTSSSLLSSALNNNNSNSNQISSTSSILVSDDKKKIVTDSFSSHIYDHFHAKANAINLATEAVLTILQIDQIIMAKPAGGPTPRAPGAPDLD